MLKFRLLSLLSVFLLGLSAITPAFPAEGEQPDPYSNFGQYTENSDMAIDHAIWGEVLAATVIVITPSTRTKASTANLPPTGSKISRGSRSPARLEGNRVMFHMLEDTHIQLVSKYRAELERLPDYYPLAEFSKDEQLAYWLNLHNAVLYETLAKRYPLSSLKKLRKAKKDKPSLWDEKLVTVAGVPLSLNDIENNILIRHWGSPMVLYGLYQGSIGGPSLPDRAFTGTNVHRLLARSAKEFINSNRGMRVRGNEMRVSMIYDWGKSAFPNWETDLGRHFAEFASTSNREKMSEVTRFNASLFDWKVADTKGGTLSAGPKHSTAANMLTARFESSFSGEGSTVASNSGFFSGVGTSSSGVITPGAFDHETAELLKGLAQERREAREGTVTSIECGPDDDSCLEEPAEDGDSE